MMRDMRGATKRKKGCMESRMRREERQGEKAEINGNEEQRLERRDGM